MASGDLDLGIATNTRGLHNPPKARCANYGTTATTAIGEIQDPSFVAARFSVASGDLDFGIATNTRGLHNPPKARCANYGTTATTAMAEILDRKMLG